MKTIFAEKRRIALIVLLMFVFAFNGTHEVGAQTGGVPTGAPAITPSSPNSGSPVPGGPGYVSLSGVNFKPHDPSSSFSFTGTRIKNTGASTAYFIAPFQIPNGVTINKMVVYYVDQDAGVGNDLDVELMNLPLADGGGSTIAKFVSSGSLSGLVYGETTSIINAVVDLSMNSYALQVQLPASADVALNAVRIDYGYQISLPLVTHQ